MGTRSGGVTTRHSMAYIQPTPDEPQKTRAPTVEACFTISNWLCSPSATMYSAVSWPPEIFLAMACMTVSYGRMGYAVTTSRSARVRASATASLPEMRSSLSSGTAGAVVVATAIVVLLVSWARAPGLRLARAPPEPPAAICHRADPRPVHHVLGAGGFGHAGHDRRLGLLDQRLVLGVLTGNPRGD